MRAKIESNAYTTQWLKIYESQTQAKMHNALFNHYLDTVSTHLFPSSTQISHPKPMEIECVRFNRQFFFDVCQFKNVRTTISVACRKHFVFIPFCRRFLFALISFQQILQRILMYKKCTIVDSLKHQVVVVYFASSLMLNLLVWRIEFCGYLEMKSNTFFSYEMFACGDKLIALSICFNWLIANDIVYAVAKKKPVIFTWKPIYVDYFASESYKHGRWK